MRDRPNLDEATPADHAEWRWRSYTEHLGDLGYELRGRPADADEAEALAQAVAEYRRRSRASG